MAPLLVTEAHDVFGPHPTWALRGLKDVALFHESDNKHRIDEDAEDMAIFFDRRSKQCEERKAQV